MSEIDFDKTCDLTNNNYLVTTYRQRIQKRAVKEKQYFFNYKHQHHDA